MESYSQGDDTDDDSKQEPKVMSMTTTGSASNVKTLLDKRFVMPLLDPIKIIKVPV